LVRGLQLHEAKTGEHNAVKIAILDTRAKFDRDRLEFTYDGRLKAYKSFVLPRNTSRRPDDEDGRGTHATDLLLYIT
jgi:hypothetical protein